MKILFATSTLFPYRVDWLNELGKYSQVDIFYLLDRDSNRNHEWMMKRPETCSFRLMKGIKIPKVGKISRDFIKHVKKHGKEYDAIILDGYGFTNQLLNIQYLNKHHYTYYVNVDGIVPNENEKPSVKKFKEKLISKFPYCFCGSVATNKTLNKYGLPNERIINHPFTSLFEKDIFENISSNEEKASLRKELDIKEEKIIISVGRFTYLNGYGKGYDVLLKAAKQLDKTYGWYIIGGKPTEEFEKMTAEENLTNVHYVDFVDKETLKKYYRASDLFCLMTVSDVWGLVINEAMSCGLPVITTTKCMAGLDLVKDGENGYLVNVGDDNALVKYVSDIFSNPNTVTSMSQKSLEYIKFYTIEKMAEIHLNAIKNNIK